MWSVMFITLLITAVIFTLLSYYLHIGIGGILLKKYGAFIMIFLITIFISILLWWTLAASVVELEFPYQFYNETGNYTITGTHIYGDSTAPALMYLFTGLGTVQMIFGIGTIPFYVMDYFKKRYMKKNQEGGI